MRLLNVFCVFIGCLPLSYVYAQTVFTSPEDAKIAIVQAESDAAKLKEVYLQQDAQCHDNFFVTQCREDLKKDYLKNSAVLDERRRQAERYLRELRRQDMQARVAEKEKEAQLAEQKASQSQANYESKQQAYEARQQGLLDTPNPNPRATPNANLKDDDDVSRRDTNRANYEQKQQEAAAYAAQQEARKQAAIEDRQRRLREREAAIAQEKQNQKAN